MQYQHKLPQYTLDKGVTHEELLELLHYDPDSGLFFNKVARGSRAPVGAQTGSYKSVSDKRNYISKYHYLRINKKEYMGHKLAYWYVTGVFPTQKEVIWHVNMDTTDNRFENLRLIKRFEIEKMKQAGRRPNSSGYRGVSWSNKHGKWLSQLTSEGKHHFLGYHEDLQDAVKARKQAELDIWY
ncbi:HNH endonuclease [Vibrio breoganii]